MMNELDELNIKIARYNGIEVKDTDWSRSIVAAWDLVEEAKSHGFYYSVNFPDWNDDGTQKDGYYVRIENGCISYDGSGATVPEAICRAWLAWKGSPEGQVVE